MQIEYQYYLVSKALQIASSNSITKKLYRQIGNIKNYFFGSREIIRKKYCVTAHDFSMILDKYNIAAPGIRALELGTGWVHWDALILRNKVPCSIQLYDIWDNRSFGKFLNYCRQIENPTLRKKIGLDADIDQDLMTRLIRCKTLEECYDLLDFDYVLDPEGKLSGVENGQFDLVISNAVFEHLYGPDVETILRRTFEVLRPGGWAIHLVVMSDHIRVYAKGAHIKEYLKYSKSDYFDKYQNEIQYINLIQMPEWKLLIEAAGFEIVETIHRSVGDLSKLDVHPSWRHIPDADLACAVGQFVLRKPLHATQSVQ